GRTHGNWSLEAHPLQRVGLIHLSYHAHSRERQRRNHRYCPSSGGAWNAGFLKPACRQASITCTMNAHFSFRSPCSLMSSLLVSFSCISLSIRIRSRGSVLTIPFLSDTSVVLPSLTIKSWLMLPACWPSLSVLTTTVTSASNLGSSPRLGSAASPFALLSIGRRI